MDYYDEFGISRTASAQEIRLSYKKLARLVHPDHCSDPDLRMLAELQTKRLNGILATLLDPSQRQRYDAALTGDMRRPKTRRARRIWYWFAIVILTAICFVPRGRQEFPSAAAPVKSQVQRSNIEKQKIRVRNHRPQRSKDPVVYEEPFHPEAPVVVRRTEPEPAGEIPTEPADAVAATPAAAPAKPRSAFGGEWLFSPSSKVGRSDIYPPEYIDLRLSENSGVLRGRYRARYRVGDRAISRTVAFQFAGNAEPDHASLPWSGDGGASGEIELRLLEDGSLEVTWIARHLGTELGLISGTATLVRRKDRVTVETALQFHPFQLAVERLPLDPEDLRGLALIASGRGEHAPDLVLFGVGQRLHRLLPRLHRGQRIVHRLRVHLDPPGSSVAPSCAATAAHFPAR